MMSLQSSSGRPCPPPPHDMELMSLTSSVDLPDFFITMIQLRTRTIVLLVFTIYLVSFFFWSIPYYLIMRCDLKVLQNPRAGQTHTLLLYMAGLLQWQGCLSDLSKSYSLHIHSEQALSCFQGSSQGAPQIAHSQDQHSWVRGPPQGYPPVSCLKLVQLAIRCLCADTTRSASMEGKRTSRLGLSHL